MYMLQKSDDWILWKASFYIDMYYWCPSELFYFRFFSSSFSPYPLFVV
jgi:hypothetical protein